MGGGYELGNTGGSKTAILNLSTDVANASLTIQRTTLNTNTIPSHTHQSPSDTSEGSATYLHDSGSGGSPDGYATSTATGGSQAHTHAVSDPGHRHTITSTSNEISVLPPYYTLYFIMKL